jgi:hypothetical protein
MTTSIDADQEARRQKRVHSGNARPEDIMAATYGVQRQPAMQRYLKDIVYGANDGIVTTLVVIASVTGASMPPAAVLVLGIANLVADGFSMGTSNVLSLRSTLTAETRPRLVAATAAGFPRHALLPRSRSLVSERADHCFPTAPGWWPALKCWRWERSRAPSPTALALPPRHW